MESREFTISGIREKLRQKEFSSFELTEKVFDEIEARDGDIHAFLTTIKEGAFEEARNVDRLIGEGKELPPLAGIPVAVKDNILIKGERCTAGSKVLEEYRASYDATVISKLKAQHAVFVGKTNLDEFAMGASTENSGFSPTKNPVDLERVPGGSSGGSAAAVRARECVYALGSDTGGSIRQPGAFCGVVGLKPTYGRVSRHGLIAMASSLDQIGPLTNTVEDAAIVFAAIAGEDPLDSTTVKKDVYRYVPSDFSDTPSLSGVKVGIPKEYFVEGGDPEVLKKVREAIDTLVSRGAAVQEVSLPHTPYALACYYLLMPSEVSSNLARFDGMRYGKSVTKEGGALMDVYRETRQQGFGDEVRRRIILGTYALSAGYYDAYYLRAQRVRTRISQDFESVFKEVDVCVTPTTPTVAFRLGEKSDDPVSMYLSDIYTVSINLAGVPAISVPCGLAAGLPVGLQIIGKHFDEKTLFRVAHAFEKARLEA